MNKIILITLMATLALADIGKVAVVKGDASVERDVKIIKAHNNMGLLKQDIVETREGRLQMHFIDNTVISLGKDSRFVIVEYLYDDNSEEVAATFKIEKGFIKTITGAIGKIMPELFVLETSTTKITPHGTIWSVDVNDDSEVYKVLEGRVTLAFNDGIERKIELLAGEIASLKKSSNGSVKSFKKSKIPKNSAHSRYENSLEQNAALVSEERRLNEGSVIDILDITNNNDGDGDGAEGDGNNGHGNDEDHEDDSNPGQGG